MGALDEATQVIRMIVVHSRPLDVANFKAIKRFFYLADFFHIFRYLLVIAKVHLPYLFSHQLPIVSDQQSADVTFCQA
jgi:hypothetical protein